VAGDDEDPALEQAREIIDPISATTAQDKGTYRRWVNE
jgi:hypothetical protein